MDNLINLGKGVPILEKRSTLTPQEEMDNELTKQLLGQMIGETKINLVRSEIEQDFLDFLEEGGISFASKEYQTLHEEQLQTVPDTIIYYDQRLAFLERRMAEVEGRMK